MGRSLNSAAWKVDFDYRHKLSAADKAWLTKFYLEYYGDRYKGEPMHSAEQRRELSGRRNAERRDVINRTEVERNNLAPAKPLYGKRHYSPEDYGVRLDSKPGQRRIGDGMTVTPSSLSVEESLIEGIDLNSFLEKDAARAEAILAGKRDPALSTRVWFRKRRKTKANEDGLSA